MRKSFLYPVTLFILFVSCVTAPNVHQIVGGEDFSKVNSLLWEAYSSVFVEKNNDIQPYIVKINEFLKEKNLNKEYQSSLYGAQGLLYFWVQNSKSASKSLAKAKSLSPNTELYAVLKACLNQNPDTGANELMAVLDGSQNVFGQVILADVLARASRWREAVGIYDHVYLKTPYAVREYFKSRRDQAQKMIQFAGFDDDLSDIVVKKSVVLEDVARTLLASDSGLFPVEYLSVDELFTFLKTKKYIFQTGYTLQTKCLRQDLAYLLARIYADAIAEQSILQKFTSKYGLGGKSPVPDVSSYSWFFDSALLMVESDIMELPDGKNFYPSKEITGEELLESVDVLLSLVE